MTPLPNLTHDPCGISTLGADLSVKNRDGTDSLTVLRTDATIVVLLLSPVTVKDGLEARANGS